MKLINKSELSAEKLIEKLKKNEVNNYDLDKFYNKEIFKSVFGNIKFIEVNDDIDVYYFEMYNVYLRHMEDYNWYEVKPIKIYKTVYIEDDKIESQMKYYEEEGYTRIN